LTVMCLLSNTEKPKQGSLNPSKISPNCSMNCRRTGFMKNRIFHLKKPDDMLFSVKGTALAEFDENRNPVFVNGIVQDISRIVVQNNSSK